MRASGADDALKSIAVFFHPMEQIEVASGKFNMVTTDYGGRVHQA